MGRAIADGRADDGGGRAAGRARRDDGRARRGGRARAARRRLALPVFRDAHLHRARRRTSSTRSTETAHEPIRRAPRSCSTSAASSTATAPTSAARSTAATRRTTTSRPTRSCSPRRRRAAPPPPPARPPRDVNAACRRADRGGGARRALPPPDGPRHRHGRPRAAVHLRGGRDAARARDDLHRRAVDHHPRPLQRPDRGHRRVRGGRRARSSTPTRRPRREQLNYLGATPASRRPCRLRVEDRVLEILRRDEDLRRLDQREERARSGSAAAGSTGRRLRAPPGAWSPSPWRRASRSPGRRPVGQPARSPTSWPGHEGEVVGGIGIVGAPEREPERRLPVAVFVEPSPTSASPRARR